MISVGVNPMTTRIVRVGNTLTVEIPEELVAQAALPVGEPVEWVPNGSGSIALVKHSDSVPAKPRRRITLDEILEGIPEGAEMEKIDWGPDRGAEIW
jgi:antitoxin component of MazEF toxin-antitoxin module